MLVHRRVTIWVERGTVRVKCLAQEHNTMSPARPRTRTTRSGVERTNHEATTPPTCKETVSKKSSVTKHIAPGSILNQSGQLLRKARKKTRVVVFTHTYFEQISLATLFTTQNCTKMLRNVTLYRLHIFASDQKKKRENNRKFFFFLFL